MCSITSWIKQNTRNVNHAMQISSFNTYATVHTCLIYEMTIVIYVENVPLMDDILFEQDCAWYIVINISSFPSLICNQGHWPNSH